MIFSDPDAVCHFSHPLGDVSGAALYDEVFAPLLSAFPDMERRDIISASGTDQGVKSGSCAGHYVGRFVSAAYLGIPPTGTYRPYPASSEFYRFSAGRIQEIQAIVRSALRFTIQAGVWLVGTVSDVNGAVPASSQPGRPGSRCLSHQSRQTQI